MGKTHTKNAKKRPAPNFAEMLAVEEQALAAKLRSVRATVTHDGEKGWGLEMHAMELMRSILPAEYGLASGFVACARPQPDGSHLVELSPQIDIVIYDAIRGGALTVSDGLKVFPIECVHGAVEVKASLYKEVGNLYSWSSKLRSLDVRHYLFDPERYVNPRAEEEAKIEQTFAILGAEGRGSYRVLGMPRQKTLSWMRLRCFALAFEYGRPTFTLDAARERLASAFQNPGHFHAVFVPDCCVLWNTPAHEHPERLGGVMGTAESPLGRFRTQVIDVLASFPRPSDGASMDLRPYFGGGVLAASGPMYLVPEY